MSATLAEVIQAARHTYGLGQNPDTWMWEVTDRYGPTLAFKLPADAENYLNSRITAAVAAHLASPAVVERAARAMYGLDPCIGNRSTDPLTWDELLEEDDYPLCRTLRDQARAALAAAVGGDGTEWP